MQVKVCTKCGKELPATIEYFSKSSKGKYGLRADCKECFSVYRKEHYNNNKNEIREKQNLYYNQYYIKNKEQISESKKEYYKLNRKIILNYSKKYQGTHKQVIKISKQKYMRENRNLFNGYKQIRRAMKSKLPSTLTSKQWEQAKNDFHNKCCYCGVELPLEQEHFIPLSKGGEYTINNIIPSCKSCNSSKRDRNFFEWYPKQESYNKDRENFILEYLNYTTEDTQQLSIL